MSNIQYIEIIKAKLSEAGYSSALLDALTRQLISIAEREGVNVLSLLDEMIEKNVDLRKSKDLNRQLPQTTNGMTYTTHRYETPTPSRFISRQIINR